MTDGDLVLALDLGTSSLRGALFDAAGRQLAPAVQVVHPHRAAVEPGGGFDPAPIAESMRSVIGRCTEHPGRVGTVAVSALWHSVLGVDDEDAPVSEVLTWESTAAADAVEDLAARLGAAGLDATEYRRRTGGYLHPSYPVAAIRLLTDRGVRARRWTDLTSWLLRRVLGVDVGWSPEIAAGSGLWDQAAGCWDPDVLAAAAVDPATLGTPWTAPVEIPTGPLSGARLVPTFADGICHNVGLGATGPRTCALAVGTSGSLRLLLDDDAGPVPHGLWRYRLPDGRVAVGASTSAAGNVVAWAGALTGEPTPSTLGALTRDEPPPHDGLVVVPDVAGERGPGYRWDASGAITGLRLHHAAADVTREILLATAGVFAEAGELLLRYEPRVERVIASGGVVTRVPGYAQLLADAVGRPVEVGAVAESSLRGAALRAAHGTATDLDPRTDPDDGSSVGEPPRVLHPRPAWTAAIRERREAAIEVASRLHAGG